MLKWENYYIFAAIKNDTTANAVVIYTLDLEMQMRVPEALAPRHQKYRNLKYLFSMKCLQLQFYHHVKWTGRTCKDRLW